MKRVIIKIPYVLSSLLAMVVYTAVLMVVWIAVGKSGLTLLLDMGIKVYYIGGIEVYYFYLITALFFEGVVRYLYIVSGNQPSRKALKVEFALKTAVLLLTGVISVFMIIKDQHIVLSALICVIVFALFEIILAKVSFKETTS